MADKSLQTVLLKHHAPQGDHYDWLLEDPSVDQAAEHRLWAGRITIPTQDWGKYGVWEVTALPHHRYAYLRYEGKISDDRGWVERVDDGYFEVITWDKGMIWVDIKMKDFAGEIDIRQVDDNRWTARIAGTY